MAEIPFHGAGLAFPVQADPSGSLVLRSGPDKIEESIRLVLSTRPGERPMRPTFGCAAYDHVFAPASSPRTIGAVCRAVEEALTMWEPRIEVRSVVAWPAEGETAGLYVEVEYVVRATNDPRNLVHPFYAIPPEPAGGAGPGAGQGVATGGVTRAVTGAVVPGALTSGAAGPGAARPAAGAPGRGPGARP